MLIPRPARLLTLACAITALLLAPRLPAADAAAPLPLLDAAKDAPTRLVPACTQVTVAASEEAAAPGPVVTIQPGKEGYPGVRLNPAAGTAAWDLSAYGHVELRATNLGTTPLALALRVDNAGPWQDNPWNTESATIKPGASGTVTVVFGYQYGHKKGYALKPGAVVSLLFFALKSPVEQKFRVDAVIAGGPAGEAPPIAPGDVRVKPTADGVLAGPGVAADTLKVAAFKNAAAKLLTDGPAPVLEVTVPAGAAEAGATVQPALGRWDLRTATDVRVTLTNAGAEPVTPLVRVESNGGASDTVAAAAPIAPGASAEIAVPFAARIPWAGIADGGSKTNWDGVKGTGSKFTSDAVSGVTVLAPAGQAAATLRVTRIAAALTPATLPAWLGHRPPVDGTWSRTFDEEFDGTAVDLAKWNNEGPNYWDRSSHWSKDNVVLSGGVARLHYEKKTGFNNDNPKEKESAYQSGYLDTYGKFTQRYGYFEARMKLPAAPGLWPAFWLMPDRGVAAGEQWRRQDTAHGGMEFDVMEHLTRWGQNRYNIAMHWDGYQKSHKQTGSTAIYVQPDKDGFLTSGLLWTPGLLVFYCQGREIARWEDTRVSIIPADLMFTLPCGGWDNNALDDAKLPADFVVDYVRVWQRDDLAALPPYVYAPPPPAAPAVAPAPPADAALELAPAAAPKPAAPADATLELAPAPAKP